MDKEIQSRVDAVRRRRSEVENHVIDMFVAGRVSRREFVRAGSVIGMSLPLLAFIAEACGGSTATGGASPAPSGGSGGRKGGRLKLGHQAPAGPLDPILTADLGRLTIVGMIGEYLAFSDKDFKLRPVLAESWTPNADGSQWTFKIRQGVKFNDGTPMTARDVAATFNRLADPGIKGNNALSNLKGVLSKGNVTAPDDTTAVFKLDSPNGNFPYLVSSDNYNSIILPATYDGNWDRTFIGTGPWKGSNYVTNQSLTLDRNPNYWDKDNTPRLDGIDITFFADPKAAILAYQSGSLNMLSFFDVANGAALLNDPNTTVTEIATASHRQIHLRTDQAPFDNKLVRQAVAFAIDREALVKGLWNGKALVADDHPFFKFYPSADNSVGQRVRDITKARDLMSQAGKAGGFAVTLYTEKLAEIPDLAALVQAALKELNISVNLNITDAGTYYDKAWLNSPLGITDYGHRGVPNTYLKAPLLSAGTWNAAHFKNPDYDALVRQYEQSIDLASQQKAAGQIERLLLDQTPLVIPYTYSALTATKKGITSIETTGMGQLNLRRTALG